MADSTPVQTAFGSWLTNKLTPAATIAKAMTPKPAPSQNAVSGVDTAMAKHADQVHPVSPPPALRTN